MGQAAPLTGEYEKAVERHNTLYPAVKMARDELAAAEDALEELRRSVDGPQRSVVSPAQRPLPTAPVDGGYCCAHCRLRPQMEDLEKARGEYAMAQADVAHKTAMMPLARALQARSRARRERMRRCSACSWFFPAQAEALAPGQGWSMVAQSLTSGEAGYVSGGPPPSYMGGSGGPPPGYMGGGGLAGGPPQGYMGGGGLASGPQQGYMGGGGNAGGPPQGYMGLPPGYPGGAQGGANPFGATPRAGGMQQGLGSGNETDLMEEARAAVEAAAAESLLAEQLEAAAVKRSMCNTLLRGRGAA